MNWTKIKEYINVTVSFEEDKPNIRVFIPLLKVGLLISIFKIK